SEFPNGVWELGGHGQQAVGFFHFPLACRDFTIAPMNSASPTWYDHLAAFGRTLKQGLLQLLYPNACWVCGLPLPPDVAHFCEACRHALTHDPHPTCPRCSSTVGPFVHLEDGC